MIFDLLKDLNEDCSFTDKINESSYIEKTNGILNNKKINYHNIVSCIVSEYDSFYLSILDNEKKMYMKKLIIEICSEIEEKGDSKYHNYKFNEKLMKPSIIQYGLQMWEKKDNYISSIYYLNEYYKKHFIIIYDNRIYETCLKDYPKVYLKYSDGDVFIVDSLNNEMNSELKNLFEIINLKNDIKKDKKNVYQMKLNPISKYKLDDLKELAKEYNISLKNGSKNKTKQVLYDEINLYKLNE